MDSLARKAEQLVQSKGWHCPKSRKDVQRCYREFLRIKDKHGVLTSEIIVQEARRANSPLHPYFTWNDTSAAHKHRLSEAATLIRTVYVTVQTIGSRNTDPVTINVFHSVKDTKTDGTSFTHYVTVSEVAAGKDYREYVVQQAMSRAKTFADDYSTVIEVQEIVKAIRKVLQQRVDTAA